MTGREFKDALKRGLKSALRRAGRASAGTRVLTYHSIHPHRRHEMNVRPPDFRAQMAWLAGHYPVISMEAAVNGTPGVAITFDDGYADNLHHAAPVLREFGLPATVFMVAGRAGAALDGDPEPENGRLMTWEELREITAAGVEIGSHTLTHPRLARLSIEAQREEIYRAREILREQLCREIAGFAYPYGTGLDFTAVSERVVEEAGHAWAASNRYGSINKDANKWKLSRIWIDATDTMDVFQAKVDGRLDALRILDTPAGYALRNLVNRHLYRDS